MKFADIILLAKAGYKPSDIKELLELCETDPETKKKEIPEEIKNKVKEESIEKVEDSEVDPFERIAKE